MSKTATQSLEGNILHSFSLADQFLTTCPDEIWGKKFGGWPVWQQLFHAFSAVDFFLRAQEAAEEAPIFGPGVGELRDSTTEVPSKVIVQEFIVKVQAKVRAYIEGLDDAALGKKNEGLSSRMGRDVTHAATLGLLAGHTLYHLGSCDAALREHGLPGVF